jgi:lysophospholipase L1-like esterase
VGPTRLRIRLTVASLAGATALIAGGTAIGAPRAVAGAARGQASAPTVYYLATGDSLATGFAAPPGQGYVDDLAVHYRSQIPGLAVANVGCSSETTDTMIHGGICRYPQGSQLGAAEAFLASHQGAVGLITIDIGGNDVLPCASSPTAAACFTQALATMDANLTQILAGLRQAAGVSVPIVAMNYFDPLLIYWLDGPAGQATAQQSATGLGVLNDHLASDYTSFGVPVADVAASFFVGDFSDLVSSPWGTIPKNVALTCTWLDVLCRIGGPQGFGDDANAAGYQVIATAFEQVIPPLVPSTPPQPVVNPLPVVVAPKFTG